MADNKIKINRAPVLTLWAAVVAERLGYERETALTLGRAVAGLNAQSKGRRLGIYEAKSDDEKAEERKPEKSRETEFIDLLGRDIPAVRTPQGLRAAVSGEVIHPESVEKYLRQKFGGDLDAVREAMAALAEAHTPTELEGRAYDLYEEFRPSIPEGKRGWGAQGVLDLNAIRALAK
jgi:hypothetical protein